MQLPEITEREYSILLNGLEWLEGELAGTSAQPYVDEAMALKRRLEEATGLTRSWRDGGVVPWPEPE